MKPKVPPKGRGKKKSGTILDRRDPKGHRETIGRYSQAGLGGRIAKSRTIFSCRQAVPKEGATSQSPSSAKPRKETWRKRRPPRPTNEHPREGRRADTEKHRQGETKRLQHHSTSWASKSYHRCRPTKRPRLPEGHSASKRKDKNQRKQNRTHRGHHIAASGAGPLAAFLPCVLASPKNR
jgi:hypothetical protein